MVETDKGSVRGTLHEGYRTFQGIPYAAPPVGDLRWRPPQPAEPWRETLDATEPGSQCAQLARLGSPTSYGEDCLYLNVTTPHRPDGPPEDLAVMVWIHGGGFTTGSAAQYDASKLAVEGDVVVVTVNYRLATLGFLAHPALSAEDPWTGSGNYALEDQQAALRWVQRNATAFGGDPDNVTVFGESAGGNSVCANLVSPTATGLFDRAISQSYSCATTYATREEAEAAGLALAAEVGCTEAAAAACLRATPAEDLLEAWTGGGFVVGTAELPNQPVEALRTDRFHHVPLMLGNTLDEMRYFVGAAYDAQGRPVTAEQYEEIIRSTYGDAADEVLARYPVGDYPTPSIALARVQTDHGSVLSTCSHLASYRLASAGPSPVPVYAYQFADRSAPPLVDIPDFDEGAEHGTELNFLFPRVFGGELSPAQERLSSAMVRYWTQFAHDGNPNDGDGPQWPRFESADDVLAFAPPDHGGIRTVDVAEASNCDFWDSLPVPDTE